VILLNITINKKGILPFPLFNTYHLCCGSITVPHGGTIYLNILSTSIKNARMINASSARTGDLYMLNTANVQTIFEKSKKKQLFYVMHEDIW
jgi:hypothetical protein